MRIGWASNEVVPDADGNLVGGGCFHYRMRVPADYISSHSEHECFYGELVGKSETGELGVRDIRTMEIAWNLDVVVIQRYYNEGLHQNIARARAIGQVVLNDVDDWFEGIDPSNRAWWTTHPKSEVRAAFGQEGAKGNRNAYARNIRAGNGVICSTPFLGQKYAAFNALVVPNLIDIDRWIFRPTTPDSSSLRVGWLGHVDYRSSRDLAPLNGIIGPWLKRTGSTFVHIGDIPGGRQRVLRGLGMESSEANFEPVGTCSINHLPEHMNDNRFDIGLVPLDNNPFNNAKSHLKGMEYAASGIPSIATATDPYRDYNGTLLARRPIDWRKHLDRLLDPSERAAEAGRALEVAKRWTIEAKGHLWLEALNRFVNA